MNTKEVEEMTDSMKQLKTIIDNVERSKYIDEIFKDMLLLNLGKLQEIMKQEESKDGLDQ